MTENHRTDPPPGTHVNRVAAAPTGNDDELRNALQAKTATFYDEEAFATLAERLAATHRETERAQQMDTLDRLARIRSGLTPLMHGRNRR